MKKNNINEEIKAKFKDRCIAIAEDLLNFLESKGYSLGEKGMSLEIALAIIIASIDLTEDGLDRMLSNMKKTCLEAKKLHNENLN